MKKPSKTTLRNKLDKICSLIIRAKGSCERCGNTQNLQCCHIFSRHFMNTRWALENLLCLCPDCHINFAHKSPILFAEFVKNKIGEEAYEQLKEMHNIIAKYTIEDLQTKYKVLQTLYTHLEKVRNNGEPRD
jgi:5-methylcytosine-specific restriction endonuclease McrA